MLKCRFFASLLRFLFGGFAVAWAHSGLRLLRFSSSFLAFSSCSLSVSLHPLRLFCAACSERVRSGRRACSVQAPFAPAPFPPFPCSLPVASLRPFLPGRVFLCPALSASCLSLLTLRFPAFPSSPGGNRGEKFLSYRLAFQLVAYILEKTCQKKSLKSLEDVSYSSYLCTRFREPPGSAVL